MLVMTFEGAGQIIKLEIDRESKKFFFTGPRTNYQKVEMPWNKLFDPGKEKIQEEITNKLDDRKFKLVFEVKMSQMGYKLKGGKIKNATNTTE